MEGWIILVVAILVLVGAHSHALGTEEAWCSARNYGRLENLLAVHDEEPW